MTEKTRQTVAWLKHMIVQAEQEGIEINVTQMPPTNDESEEPVITWKDKRRVLMRWAFLGYACGLVTVVVAILILAALGKVK